jgi:hypothetical protein
VTYLSNNRSALFSIDSSFVNEVDLFVSKYSLILVLETTRGVSTKGVIRRNQPKLSLTIVSRNKSNGVKSTLKSEVEEPSRK